MSTEKTLEETKLSGTVVYEGSFFTVQRDQVRLPNARVAQREFIRHPGAVVIIPLLDDRQVVLERQYRYPLGQVLIELPAGKIDPGEETLVCAQRELREETGYTASSWELITRVHNAAGYSDECLYFYLAQGLTAGEKLPDEDELLDVFTLSIPELMAGVQDGSITDAKTVIGAYWLDKYVRDRL